jgi:hypothetical protein
MRGHLRWPKRLLVFLRTSQRPVARQVYNCRLRQASCVAGLGVGDTQGHLASVRESEEASD